MERQNRRRWGETGNDSEREKEVHFEIIDTVYLIFSLTAANYFF